MNMQHRQRVLDSFDVKTDYKWINILFEDFPGWDDEGTAPLCVYILHNILLEKNKSEEWIQNRRAYVMEKVFYYHHQRGINKETAVEFYQQFPVNELRTVGI